MEDKYCEGLGLRMPSGSILLESARHVIHSTTRVVKSAETQRIGLVFYRHRDMDSDMHSEPCL